MVPVLLLRHFNSSTSGLACSKLMILLVYEIQHFQVILNKILCRENSRSFCTLQKLFSFICQQNCVYTRRLSDSLTYDFV